jgi:hypothetical protein
MCSRGITGLTIRRKSFSLNIIRPYTVVEIKTILNENNFSLNDIYISATGQKRRKFFYNEIKLFMILSWHSKKTSN